MFCFVLAAVVQKKDTQQYMTRIEGQQIRGRQPRQTKLGKLPRIIGLPLSVVESNGMGCGNRSGEKHFACRSFDENEVLFFISLQCSCSKSLILYIKLKFCVCARVRVCAWACVCVYVGGCMCARAHLHVHICTYVRL
jgi:hypothetical protein